MTIESMPSQSTTCPLTGSPSWGHSLPKIDLHRHLEGSIRLNTLIEIALEHGIALPYIPSKLNEHVQITHTPRDFTSFLHIFDILRSFYKSKEIIQRITRLAIQDAAKDNVRYLELRFNPLALAQTQNFPFNDVVAWVVQAAEQAQIATGTRTCLILQIPRQESCKVAEEIVDIAIAQQGEFVRGIDLAGDEEKYASSRFVQPLQRAFEAGLNITVHAGEAGSAQNITDAVTYLHAQRIGHGIRAVGNALALKLLKDQGVTLEICPTSNIKTSLVGDYAHHPLITLLKSGQYITLNTDDPSIFLTTSSQEIIAAVRDIGLPPHHIYQFIRNGVEAAFIPAEEHSWLRELFRT
ncbi:MAG: adenosine deaminase, partial [Anaerolineales bacterium]